MPTLGGDTRPTQKWAAVGADGPLRAWAHCTSAPDIRQFNMSTFRVIRSFSLLTLLPDLIAVPVMERSLPNCGTWKCMEMWDQSTVLSDFREWSFLFLWHSLVPLTEGLCWQLMLSSAGHPDSKFKWQTHTFAMAAACCIKCKLNAEHLAKPRVYIMHTVLSSCESCKIGHAECLESNTEVEIGEKIDR